MARRWLDKEGHSRQREVKAQRHSVMEGAGLFSLNKCHENLRDNYM